MLVLSLITLVAPLSWLVQPVCRQVAVAFLRDFNRKLRNLALL